MNRKPNAGSTPDEEPKLPETTPVTDTPDSEAEHIEDEGEPWGNNFA